MTASTTEQGTYLRWRKGQDFDRGALRSHGLVGVGRQSDAPSAPVAQYGGGCDAPRRDGDEFSFAAFA